MNATTVRSHTTKKAWFATAAVVLLSSLLIAVIRYASSVSAVQEIEDGRSPATAGVSCWEIKKNNPTAPSGRYFLVTPQMQQANEYYCDMDTDGGGWLLVGRGRNNWTFSQNGQNRRDEVLNETEGPNAFDPAAYSSAEVNQLMNAMNVTDMSDGVRIKRTTNSAGTSFDEIRWQYDEPTEWNWSFPGRSWIWTNLYGIKLSSASLNGSPLNPGGTTFNAGFANGKRVTTSLIPSLDSQRGFAIPSTTGASTAPNNHLWAPSGEAALPFAQVFIRPKLVSENPTPSEKLVSFPEIPAGGLASAAAPPSSRTVQSNPVDIGWGVQTGFDPNDAYPTLNSLVFDIEIIGNTVFVGGKFHHIRNSANGTLVAQRYLAAFNKQTGAHIASFNPQLDGAVYSLAKSPDGKLLVGGNFSAVSGAALSDSLVKLNPTDGSVDPAFNVTFTRADNGRPHVRALSVKDGYVYVGGQFNSVSGGSQGTTTEGIGALAKVAVSSGEPVVSWRPSANGSVEKLHASPTSDQLWVVGRAKKISGTDAAHAGAVSMTTGRRSDPAGMQRSLLEADGPYQVSTEPTWAVREIDGDVYLGGSQHYLGRFDPSNGFTNTGWSQNGNGDYQDINSMFGIIYAGCHCGSQNRTVDASGELDFTTIRAFGAWDKENFERTKEFIPDLRDWVEGGWAIAPDESTGCLWTGGDYHGGPKDTFISGIAKLCLKHPIDIVPPSTPGQLTAKTVGTNVELRWNKSTDDLTGLPRYQVFRNNRPIALTYNTTKLTVNSTEPATYAVRALDVFGNYSETTPVLNYGAPSEIGTRIAYGSTWKFSTASAAPLDTWKTTLDVSAWSDGTAPLGAGNSGETTTIELPATTQYFVNDLTIDEPSTIGSIDIRGIADDGAVVYVNGQEVARSNIAFGPPSHNTTSWSEVTNDGGRGFIARVPASLFVRGTNRIAVEVHQHAANDSDALFDLQLVTKPIRNDAAPQMPGPPTVTDVTSNTAKISWPQATDNNLAGYAIYRDNELLVFRSRNKTSYGDQRLTENTSYEYSVVAFDMSGHASAPQVVTASTTAKPVVADVGVKRDSTWKLLHGEAPLPDWKSTGDVSTWTSIVGSAGLGNHGHANELTKGPITSYLVSDFDISDPANIAYARIDALIDDGAIISINGTEITRSNMPFGAVEDSTTSWSEKADPEKLVRYFPMALLVPGTNRMSIELHQHVANDTDSFVSATLRFGTDDGDTVAPSTVTPTIDSVTKSSVKISWTASTDDTRIAYYEVRRDGVPIAYLNRWRRKYNDQQLNSATDYRYEIVGVDTNGNESSPQGSIASTS